MKRNLACIAFGFGVASAGPALSQDNNLVFTNPSGWTTTFYGQINMTYQGVDDGVENHNQFVNNTNSPSRIGLWIDGPAEGDTRLRFNFETALGIRATAETNQIANPPYLDWQRTDIRKLEVTYKGNYGTFWAGQGSMAADGIAEYDKSGTSVAGYSAVADTAGAYLFRLRDTLVVRVPVGAVFRNFDAGRRMRVRYDTPSFAGFTFSAAYGQDVLATAVDADYTDVAARYAFENDQMEFAAGLAYSWFQPQNGLDEEHLFGSASLLHKPTGLNLTIAGGQNTLAEADYFYAKAGWLGKIFPIGPSALSFDLYSGTDFLLLGTDSDAWGVQAVQHFESLHLEAYLSYREYSYSGVLAEYRNIDSVLFGARWKF
ncbi:porin [Sedimentitalea sp. JM2-8]|uniref:Porin n=1 Tax=Sedimentitalea xiamensis TaxID=3050037 RepID=A0ABT7FL72_9RHOB|nr:porin [Sedimentitalea xiamensis]MDK3075907.1 porin [Sedimentitalea xiamensis]